MKRVLICEFHQETNTFNPLPMKLEHFAALRYARGQEAYDLCKKLNLSNTKILADIFHMYVENEDFSVMGETVDEMCHVHINNPLTRTCPAKEENKYIRSFAESLNDAGYNKTVTIESAYNDFTKDISDAIIYLKEVFAK